MPWSAHRFLQFFFLFFFFFFSVQFFSLKFSPLFTFMGDRVRELQQQQPNSIENINFNFLPVQFGCVFFQFSFHCRVDRVRWHNCLKAAVRIVELHIKHCTALDSWRSANKWKKSVRKSDGKGRKRRDRKRKSARTFRLLHRIVHFLFSTYTKTNKNKI